MDIFQSNILVCNFVLVIFVGVRRKYQIQFFFMFHFLKKNIRLGLFCSHQQITKKLKTEMIQWKKFGTRNMFIWFKTAILPCVNIYLSLTPQFKII